MPGLMTSEWMRFEWTMPMLKTTHRSGAHRRRAVAALSGCSYNKFTAGRSHQGASGDRCRTSCSGATI